MRSPAATARPGAPTDAARHALAACLAVVNAGGMQIYFVGLPGWFAAAGVPTPELIDLPSGATTIIARR